VFESVMVPYYVMPALYFAVLAAFRAWARRLTAVAAAVGVTVMTHYRMGEWTYFAEMTALLVVVLIASRPTTTHRVDRFVPPDPEPAGDGVWSALARVRLSEPVPQT
jgi:hypothetical protein